MKAIGNFNIRGCNWSESYGIEDPQDFAEHFLPTEQIIKNRMEDKNKALAEWLELWQAEGLHGDKINEYWIGSGKNNTARYFCKVSDWLNPENEREYAHHVNLLIDKAVKDGLISTGQWFIIEDGKYRYLLPERSRNNFTYWGEGETETEAKVNALYNLLQEKKLIPKSPRYEDYEYHGDQTPKTE